MAYCYTNERVLNINYSELFVILNKQWASVNDIKQLCGNGIDCARRIRNEIEADIIASGKKLLYGKEKKVPMSRVIDYLNMDINYIANMAILEKKINNDEQEN